MSIPNDAAPLVDALKAGIPIGKIKPGELCPKLPAVPMIVLLDDIEGKGPEAFDTTALFAEIDSIVFVPPLLIGSGAQAVAAAARLDQRALLVQAPTDCLARWIAMILGNTKLMANFMVLGMGEDVPLDIREIVDDIQQIIGATRH